MIIDISMGVSRWHGIGSKWFSNTILGGLKIFYDYQISCQALDT